MNKLWTLIHHVIAHPIVGLSFGAAWAWRFHDWTAEHIGESEREWSVAATEPPSEPRAEPEVGL